VVLELASDALPVVLHWGADLGDLSEEDLAALLRAGQPDPGDSRVYTQTSVSVLPQHSSGWLGRPGVTGSRHGRAWSVSPSRVDHVVEHASRATGSGPGVTRVRSSGVDEASDLEVGTELELHPGGLLRLRAWVRNRGQPYEVTALEPALPVPPAAVELLDMAGRHTLERVPQRRHFDVGAWVRESRGGRPGHDSATVMCAGTSGFGFRAGRVWAVHLAHSGNQVLCAERSFNAWRLLRAGELLLPGEVVLDEGETYTTPWLCAAWGAGLDDVAHRFHTYLRARPQHPRRPRPVLLNTWEAVYFDHDLDRLARLADAAAEAGVERFVLDDGWFRGRRSDRSGLGDWYVDTTVWPDGLHPLVDRVRSRGMEFGLWFEPEMVNLDSDLARAHPEWLFDAGHGPGMASRYQHVLDLGHHDAYDYVLERVSALVSEYRIDFVKWDHNRPLVDAGHQPGGVPGLHRHTRALYRLLGELRRRHPWLEIESCCGGGGRIDLGILEVTDRVWASDCIDAHERQDIQRWTSLLLPPELVGTHIGSPVAHTTERAHALSFRAGTALWGHLGIEWDLTRATPAERALVARWVALHKELRRLLHTGTVVHADIADPTLRVEGVVAHDGLDAVYAVAAVGRPLTWPPGRVPLLGLAPTVRYRVRPQPPGDDHSGITGRPQWMDQPVELSGTVLEEFGVEAPALLPDQLVLIRAQAVTSPRGGRDDPPR
jgi:alpha-galactosidase